MKVVITGAGGQLAEELSARYPKWAELRVLGYGELDISSQEEVKRVIKSLNPEVIINAAAYTKVDLAESEPEKAYAVNDKGVGNLAEAARDNGARLVHISTDFVFGGGLCRPYLVTDEPEPLGVYGASKLAGERRIRQLLENPLIVRTSWLYSSRGGNFVKTILRLIKEKSELKIVSDQIGAPTWAAGLAGAIWSAVEKGLAGLHHWSDSGIASWYDFAVAIQEEGRGLGLVEKAIPIKPIFTKDYPTPARRPAYSVLNRESMIDSLGYAPPHWRVNLRNMLRELKESCDE